MHGERSIRDKVLTGLGKLGIGAAKLSWKGTKKLAKITYDHRAQIGRATVGTAHAAAAGIKTTATMAVDTASLPIYSKDRIAKVTAEIKGQCDEYQGLVNRASGKLPTLDAIAVGGDLLRSILSGGKDVSAEVLRAYEAANPDQAAQMTFQEAVKGYDNDQLPAFISRVKGKLFEMKYVDYLNDGNLPEGYHAALATSATQPGWDIAISGTDGRIADVLQAKATDSVAYVREAIEKYPHIDVVTTDEVYSHLVMNGADHISNSGLPDAALTDTVWDAVKDGDVTEIHMNWTPPLISLALIAFTTYTIKDAEAYEKARMFGNRAAKSYIAYLIGGGIAAMTQTWWLGLIAGIGSRFLAGKGRERRHLYYHLRKIQKSNAQAIRKMRHSFFYGVG